MGLVGFLIIVLWAIPMVMSMSTDDDPVSTLSGVIFSNTMVFGELWGLTKIPELPHSRWWLLLVTPILLGTYYGVWSGYSENFFRLVRDVLRIK